MEWSIRYIFGPCETTKKSIRTIWIGCVLNWNTYDSYYRMWTFLLPPTHECGSHHIKSFLYHICPRWVTNKDHRQNDWISFLPVLSFRFLSALWLLSSVFVLVVRHANSYIIRTSTAIRVGIIHCYWKVVT